MKLRIVCAFCAVSILSACASSSEDVVASYISPVTYDQMNCAQLGEEMKRVSFAVAQAAGAQDDNRTWDAVVIGANVVTLGMLWPTLFALEGDGGSTSELARLKGEMRAIQQASTQKSCGIKFNQAKG